MSVNRLPISAYLVCKDEAVCIENCIRSLSVCAEIIAVDSGSTDGTVQILERLQAEGLPLRIIQREWPGFSLQKQFALEQCTQPWALNIDADERLDADLRSSIAGLIAAPEAVAGWKIPRRPYLIGYGYVPRGVHEGRMLRLVRRTKVRYDTRLLVHESLVVDGEVRIAKRGALLHFRTFTIDQQVTKELHYASLKVQQLINEGKTVRPWRLVLSPAVYFIRYYLYRRMFRCGLPGFIQAATASLYAFLVEARFYQVKDTRDLAKDDNRHADI